MGSEYYASPYSPRKWPPTPASIFSGEAVILDGWILCSKCGKRTYVPKIACKDTSSFICPDCKEKD